MTRKTFFSFFLFFFCKRATVLKANWTFHFAKKERENKKEKEGKKNGGREKEERENRGNKGTKKKTQINQDQNEREKKDNKKIMMMTRKIFSLYFYFSLFFSFANEWHF